MSGKAKQLLQVLRLFLEPIPPHIRPLVLRPLQTLSELLMPHLTVKPVKLKAQLFG